MAYVSGCCWPISIPAQRLLLDDVVEEDRGGNVSNVEGHWPAEEVIASP